MKKMTLKRNVARIIFVLYLVALLSLVFGIDRMESSEYHYNLVLFDEIKRYFKYRTIVGNEIFLMNIVGNIIGFLPFGFLLPQLSKWNYNIIFATLLTFEMSLFIEVIQLFTRVGSFDVDDLLLNTIGGFLGYLLFLLTSRVRKKRK